MNTFKKLLVLLLAVCVVTCLFACGGGCEHTDGDGDGICEKCGEDTITPVALIEDGVANFQIVLGEDVTVDVRLAANNLKTMLRKAGVAVDIVEYDDEPTDCEIIIGTVTNRGDECFIDPHSLGTTGYAVKIVGNRVLIAGGSVDALKEAFSDFIDSIFSEDEDEMSSVSVGSEIMVREVQSDYDITDIKIGGESIRGYTIATDVENSLLYTPAVVLRDSLYEEMGIWLEIVTLDEVSDKSIVITEVERDNTPQDSFRINVRETTLYVESEYANSTEKELSYYFTKNILTASGEITLDGEVYTKDVSFVTYEMFGANGRDTKNDFAAIYATHEFANVSGQTVKATANATYYITDTRIDGKIKIAAIKTNVDWTGATFEIIDSDLYSWDGKNLHKYNIFEVLPDKEMYTLSQEELARFNEWKVGRESTKLNISLPESAMLNVINTNKKVYIRYGTNGSNADEGKDQHETVLVDKDGNIDPTTPFLLDYETVTAVEVYSINEKPITITGGIFNQRASERDISEDDGTVHSGYFERGISIERSNTLIKNVENYVTGQFTRAETENEGLKNAPYRGFFYVREANNVKLYNCTFSAKRGNGTYGIGSTDACNITYENCKQSNFFLEDGITPSTTNDEYWGLMGSSFCKNIICINSQITRYDAHAGVYNGKFIGGEIARIYLIGGGTMLVEGATIHNEYVFNLRQDYGATWNGEIIIRNCTLKTSSTSPYICNAKWTNHDYGYVCHYPSILVDNLTLSGTAAKTIMLDGTGWPSYTKKYHSSIYYEPNIHLETLSGTHGENVNPYAPPEYLKVINNECGYTYTIPKSLTYQGAFLHDTDIEGFTLTD